MEGVEDISDERWDHVFAVNTTGTMRLMREAVKHFKEVKGGVILNIISIGGLNGARAGAGYIASKRAGQPDEIAKLALFLVSDEASFVNGAIVVADGGWSAY